jgi:hypothetical protein
VSWWGSASDYERLRPAGPSLGAAYSAVELRGVSVKYLVKKIENTFLLLFLTPLLFPLSIVLIAVVFLPVLPDFGDELL